jgi:hypothetical protein
MPEAACWHFDTHNAMNRWFFRDSVGGSAFSTSEIRDKRAVEAQAQVQKRRAPVLQH